MRKIRKGEKIDCDCYIITEDEMKEYIHLKEKMERVKEMIDSYRKQYKS